MLFQNIKSDYTGYSKIIHAYHDAIQNPGPITLTFQDWFDPHLCAPLGVVLNLLAQQHSLSFDVASWGVFLNAWNRNGFLQRFKFSERHDDNQSVIHYKEFQPTDLKKFSAYVYKEILSHPFFPNASQGCKDKILESLAELFSNAVLHSKSGIIITCGQFYPQDQEIIFTIADAGVGIHKKVVVDFFRQKHNQEIKTIGYYYPSNAGQSIKWAMEDGNTTKDGPGGSGLAILKEFVILNKGFIHLVSDEGFYEYSLNVEGEYSPNVERISTFRKPFPGTFAIVKFKTDDTHSYILSSEINPNTLF